MVTTDGRRVFADVRSNSDLFCALRGGGGNFGVVTAFTYRAHPIGPEVVSGPLIFGPDQAASVLISLADHMTAAPRELAVLAVIAPLPSLPFVPVAAHGEYGLILNVVYSGDPDQGEAGVTQLAALQTPLVNLTARRSWLETNRLFDASVPVGRRCTTVGGYLPELDADVVQSVARVLKESPKLAGTETTLHVWCLGGALTEDADEDAMAFSRRDARWLWEAVGIWDDSGHDTRFQDWAARSYGLLRDRTLPHAYINLTHDLGPDWRRGVWGSAEKYARLLAAKTAWDPENLLRFNKNIPPV